MDKLRNGLTLVLTWLLTMQPWLTATAAPATGVFTSTGPAQAASRERIPVALSGHLDDRRADYRAKRDADRDVGLAEDGQPAAQAPMADLPIVDEALTGKIERGDADDVLRLIVYLDYLPHASVLEAVLTRHDAGLRQLEAERQSLVALIAPQRNLKAKIDAENYTSMFELDDRQRQAVNALGERNEALGLILKNEVGSELKELLEAYQAPVIAEIGRLGGNVEFTTIAGNTIVATLSPAAVDALAKQPGVMRIVEDSMMEGHLTVADDATMVNPADTTLLGLWDNAYDGGIYDPAIIDSGLDLMHPGMVNSTVPLRDNFYTWYVVAGIASPSYGETCCSIADLQGHGTHVAGIVGSYGTAAYPNHLGMAFGVEKLVTLKAGWLNSSSGAASMFWSDKYFVVDRALYNTAGLAGGTFGDDVDGMNLSYGIATTLDDTDGGRFWDSVVSTYPDLPVTISAGNSGPFNTSFSDPAVSYNAIVVANYNDRGTTSRTDDIVNSGSTVGPTANGRRKPDIAAPGTSISAPNTFWEAQADYINKTGTSMAAPMVLGVIMDLMNAAVFDEKAIKAVLINTAQKNLAGMNIESDTDGWNAQLGWGTMNAYAAFFHRFDVFQDSVTPRTTAGDFHLYKGVMQDEGSAGEGRDRATMVWNRHATYNTAATPSTFYSLADLNLRLYRESNNGLISSDLTGSDNVQQVRIGSGAVETDVVINAYAWSTTFSHGGATESYALATEDGFERVDHPATFSGFAFWPTEAEPNEVFTIEFWLNNNSVLASHNNQYNLELPAGWTLLSGVDTQNVGSISGGGGSSTHVIYSVRAPASAVGAQNIVVKHSHNSYNEPYGDFNWNIGINIAVDNTPPSPNPMAFSTPPDGLSIGSIDMTASNASDIHGPVQYYLDYMSSPSAGAGGTDSGWQASRSYIDVGLGTNHQYCYRSWARDNAAFPNLTTPSAILCAYSEQAAPAGVGVGAVTTSSIGVFATSVPANLTLDSSGLLLANTSNATNSGWKQNNDTWTSFGLTAAEPYLFVAQARNGDADATPASPSLTVYTLANPPAVDSLTTVSQSEISVALNANGNGSQAEYFIQNTTDGTNSGWINDTTHAFTGLVCETFYNFQARARNGDGIESIIVPLGLQSTGTCVVNDTDNDGVSDDIDNCLLVANPTQLDTDGDNIGNHCDADLNNDCLVNFADLAAMKAAFFPVNTPNADVTGDGLVNFADLAYMKSTFFNSANPGPGPGAPGNDCD